tara:strand:+ start:72 stop:1295 length:1224 start_codon:yes stop_codon:yes gene_type:complete
MAFLTNNIKIDDSDQVWILLDSADAYDTTTGLSNEIKINGTGVYSSFAGRYFGNSVAVAPNRKLVIGSNKGDVSSQRGAVHIFDSDGSNETVILAPGNLRGVSFPYFGTSVSASNDRIVVGTFSDSDATDAGSAYIINYDGSIINNMKSPDAQANGKFGRDVAIGDGRVLVGAFKEDTYGRVYVYDENGSNLFELTGDSDDPNGDFYGENVEVANGRIVIGAPQVAQSGKIHIYDLNGNEIKKIESPVGSDAKFGRAIDIGNGKIIVGAPHDNGAGNDRGSAYIYDLNGNLLKTLTAPDTADYDRFGSVVGVGDGRIVIGADGDDDLALNSGSLYIYDINGNYLEKVTPTTVSAGDDFGNSNLSLSVRNGKVLISSWQADSDYSDEGAAYVYDIPRQRHLLDLLNDF